MNNYSAVMKQDGEDRIGWVEGVPGVNAQEASRDEKLASLKVVLRQALELNRAKTDTAAGSAYEELALAL